MHRTYCTALLFFVFLEPAFTQDSAGDLARILRDKGVITNSDLEKLESSPSAERVRVLASLLEVKGVLSAAEVATVIKAPMAMAAVQPQAPAKGPETAGRTPRDTLRK